MITASATDGSGISAWIKLTLLPKAKSITITNKKGTDITGKSVTVKTVKYQLYASAKPAKASQKVTWKSSNTAVATVSFTGLVKFKKTGTVTITATSQDRGKVSAKVKLVH